MLGGFVRANKNHRNVQTVAFLENHILFDIHLVQNGGEFLQQRRNGRFSFLAKMATWPRVESHFSRARGGQARVLWMPLHGFGFEYFLNGPA